MPRTAKAESKRMRILEAGSLLFSKHGYDRTTLEDIARKAHMGKATLYYYFPEGKEAIFSAVVQHAVDNLYSSILEEMQKGATPGERFSRYIRARIGEFHDQVVLRGITEDVFGEIFPRAEVDLSMHLARELELLESLVAAAIASGEFRDVDPRLVARIVQSAMRYLADDSLVMTKRIERNRELETFLSILTHGLATRPEESPE